jgi:predicted permease
MTRQVPRFHRLLLRTAAPPDERDELVGDLDDEAALRARATGTTAARRWYRRQVRRSLLPILARRLARRFGPSRDVRPTRAVGTGVLQDLRLALRSLRGSPAFAVAAVLMLALGIGAFTVVYAFVDALVVRPLPFGDRNGRLVTIHSVHPTLTADPDDAGMSYADVIDFRRETTTLAALEVAIGRSVAISTGSDTRRVEAASVTPGLFRLLGVAPVLGRTFDDADGAAPGFESAVLLSHALWRDLLGGDARAVGGDLFLNGRAVTVAGVMPPGFAFPDEHQLWLPYRGDPTAGRQNRGWLAIGLLAPGVTFDDGAAAVNRASARLAERYPETNRDWAARVQPLRDTFVSITDEGTVLGAVSLLLLAACANLAGLVVARNLGRRREMTVRAALGARRFRLIRWLLAEAVVLAAAGGGLGLLFAAWGIRALVAWIPEPPPYWAMPALDLRVALVAVSVTALVALLSGLMPAVRLSRVQSTGALTTGARSAGAASSHRRLQHVLVVGQVAVTFSLVAGALLLGRSATALLEADAGFDHRPLYSARFYIAGDQYDPIEARAALVEQIVQRLRALPGVQGAAATGAIPTDDGGGDIRLLAAPGTAGGHEEIGAQLVPVTPGFWQAIGLSFLEGRTFTASEAADPQTRAVIVNRRLATRYWPGESAIGRTLPVAGGIDAALARIVGVVPDLVYEEFGEVTPQSELNVYVPYVTAGWRSQAVLVRVAGPAPGAVTTMVRRAIRAIDPGLAVYDELTMTARRQYNHWGAQFVGRAMTGFAIAALLLACVGAYGIASHGVAERRREIGVRIAIGATAADIRRIFLTTGARLALGGTLVGLPLAFLTARALESELFRVSPWDGSVWVLLPALLATAVVAASYWPARRASRTDPAVTLRE